MTDPIPEPEVRIRRGQALAHLIVDMAVETKRYTLSDMAMASMFLLTYAYTRSPDRPRFKQSVLDAFDVADRIPE